MPRSVRPHPEALRHHRIRVARTTKPARHPLRLALKVRHGCSKPDKAPPCRSPSSLKARLPTSRAFSFVQGSATVHASSPTRPWSPQPRLRQSNQAFPNPVGTLICGNPCFGKNTRYVYDVRGFLSCIFRTECEECGILKAFRAPPASFSSRIANQAVHVAHILP